MIIWANLDCEARWGGGSLPQSVARRVSAVSSLLSALAPAGEPVEIFAPAPVDPARIRLPDITLRTGEPARWDLAWADPNAKTANDRRVALALDEQLSTRLPGARAIDSLAQLDEHLAHGAAAAGVDRRWVCKAPWTAAGRDRAHGQGDTLDGELRVYVGRLLERFGVVLFEPWLDRVLDIGTCARLSADGTVAAQAPHTLLSDPRGGFLGIDLALPPISDVDRGSLAAATDAAGAALHRLGYTGPFTVDAFVYRSGGGTRLRPLCELNARHTFGHVARALAARFGTRVLGFGAPPAGAQVLVAPAADDPTTAWAA